MDLSQQIIIGHAGSDVAVTETQSGLKIAKVGVATGWTTNNGTKETEWHNVTAFGKQAESLEKLIRKGTRLYVSGRRSTNKYIKDDVEKTYSEIIVEKFLILDGYKEKTEDNPFNHDNSNTPF